MKTITLPHRSQALDNTDWVSHIEWAQDQLNRSGSRHQSGTIVLSDAYPISRPIVLDGHVTIQGISRAMHHIGSSCGLYAIEDFRHPSPTESAIPAAMLSWRKVHRGYSNFGAGIRNIHMQSITGVDAVHFRGAQQSAGIDNLVVRGFGAAVGLSLAGDTYNVTDVFIDSGIGGGPSKALPGATGIKSDGQLYCQSWRNITTHNCEVGVSLHDVLQLSIDTLESETTTWPLDLTRQAGGLTIRNMGVRHTNNLLRLAKPPHPNNLRIALEGFSDKSAKIIHPDGEGPVGRSYDVVIEGSNSKGVYMTNLRKERQP